MIFDIQTSKDKWLEKIYQQSMAELDEFFRLNWQQNQPKVFIVLSRDNFEKESDNTYSKESISIWLWVMV